MDKLLKKFIEGTCSQDEFDQVVEMLRSGNIPSEALRWMKQHWYATEKNVGDFNGAIDFESVLHKIHHGINLLESKQDRRRFLKVRRIYVWMQVAAAIAIIAISSFGIWYAGNKGLFKEESIYTVSSVRGQSSKVTMPDGSEIWLNGESSLVYGASFGITNRKLSLKGEGFFSVRKNSKVPFVVEVGSTKVTALGTGFNIDAYRGDDHVVVTLETGKILVENNDKKTEITPGQQVVIKNSGFEVFQVDSELYTSWRRGQVVFKDETLFAITTQLEKMYDIKFIYKTDTLKSFRYRGTIRLDNSVLKALEMLKLSTDIKYKVEGNQVVLEK